MIQNKRNIKRICNYFVCATLFLLQKKSYYMNTCCSAHIINFDLLAEHTVRHRALMEASEFPTTPQKARKAPEIIPAYQGYGAYYIDLYLGSPPQRQTVLVDTGSENIAIPCSGCKDCGNTHTDRPFDPSFSSSFLKLNCSDCLSGKCSKSGDKCEVGSSYVEGSSWSGFEAQDFVYAGGRHDQALDIHHQEINDDSDDAFSGTDPNNAIKYRFPLKFTCMEKNEGEFKKQKADGIMGLNMKDASFWMQMWNTGNLVKRQFSICLRRHPFSSLLKQDRPVGVMTLGGTDERLNSSSMAFMKMTQQNKKTDGFYHVRISKIYLSTEGGQRLGGSNPDIDFTKAVLLEDDKLILNKDGVVIDSGTTDTILTKDLKPTFDRAWQAITGIDFPDQYIELSANELKSWPTIIFQMKSSSSNDALIAFPPSSYMSLDFSTGRYKPTLWFHDKYGTSILGSNFMRSHNVLFDIENGRIGMAESDCDYNELISGEKTNFPDVYADAKEVKQLLQIEHMQSICEDKGASCFVHQSIWGITIFLSITLVCIAFFEVYQHYKGSAACITVDLVMNKSFDCERNEDMLYPR